MGNWVIIIHGQGAYNNSTDYPADADRMAVTFVQKLKDVGHVITGATFTKGGEENLEDPYHGYIDSQLPEKNWETKLSKCLCKACNTNYCPCCNYPDCGHSGHVYSVVWHKAMELGINE